MKQVRVHLKQNSKKGTPKKESRKYEQDIFPYEKKEKKKIERKLVTRIARLFQTFVSSTSTSVKFFLPSSTIPVCR
jgi:hypothetical protein